MIDRLALFYTGFVKDLEVFVKELNIFYFCDEEAVYALNCCRRSISLPDDMVISTYTFQHFMVDVLLLQI